MKLVDTVPRAHSTTLADEIYAIMKNDIISGVFPTGTVLSSAEICKHYHASRMPVRDALLMLEGNGFVKIMPQIGVFIKPLSITELEEISDIRIALEKLALSIVYNNRSELVFSRIYDLIDLEARESDEYRLAEIRKEMHLTIYAMSDRPELYKILKSQYERMDRYIYFYASELEKGNVDNEYKANHAELMRIFMEEDLSEINEAIEKHITEFKIQIRHLLHEEEL